MNSEHFQKIISKIFGPSLSHAHQYGMQPIAYIIPGRNRRIESVCHEKVRCRQEIDENGAAAFRLRPCPHGNPMLGWRK